MAADPTLDGSVDLPTSESDVSGDDRLPDPGLTAAAIERWGFCGVRAVDDGHTIAALWLTPSDCAAGWGAVAAAVPRSSGSGNPDAATVLSVWVREDHRGHGVGRHLVQSAAGLLVRRNVSGLEAVGDYREPPTCLPVGWLQAVGFEVVRPHPVTPGLRMNLHSTLRWKPDLGAAWSRLTSLVAQPAPPQPNGAAWREVTPTH